MGHTADIAILDLTHSDGVGFTNDLAMLNVGLTRARYGLIVTGNKKVAIRSGPRGPFAGNLKRIGAFGAMNKAVASLYESQMPGNCDRCFSTKHKKGKACKVELTCKNCGQPHHVRYGRARVINSMPEDLALEDCRGMPEDVAAGDQKDLRPLPPSAMKKPRGKAQKELKAAAAEAAQMTEEETDRIIEEAFLIAELAADSDKSKGIQHMSEKHQTASEGPAAPRSTPSMSQESLARLTMPPRSMARLADLSPDAPERPEDTAKTAYRPDESDSDKESENGDAAQEEPKSYGRYEARREMRD
jgi:hypothetical protein